MSDDARDDVTEDQAGDGAGEGAEGATDAVDVPTAEEPPGAADAAGADGAADEDAPDADTAEELARLRAEVATLEQKVDRREAHRATGRRVRRGARNVLVAVLVVLTAFSFTAAGIGVWASRNFLNNEVFASRIGTVIEEQAVQQALARFTTKEVMTLVDVQNLIAEALPDRAQILAPTLASGVESFVRGKVEEVFATPEFQRIFETIVDTAHDQAVALLEGKDSAVVQANADSVTLNFLPVIDQVLARIGETSPEILGRNIDIPTVTVEDLPDEARQKIGDALGVTLDDNFGTITVYDAGALKAAQEGVALFNKVVWLLVALAIVLIPLTLLASAHRRRTLLQLVVAISVGMVLVRRLSLRIQDDLLALVRIPDNVPAVEIVTDRVIDPLRLGAEIVLWVAAAIIVVALVTGPYPWAVSLRAKVAGLARSLVASTRDEETVVWIDRNRDALQWGGAIVGLLLLWFLDVSWLGFFLLLALVAAYEVAVVRLADRAPVDEDGGAGPDVAAPAAPAAPIDAG